MSKDNSFLKGAFWGVLIGGASALLLAPKSGEETKTEIINGTKNAGRQLKKLLNDLEDYLGGQIDHLRDVAQDLRGEVGRDSQQLIERAQVLKADIGESSSSLARSTGEIGHAAMSDIKRLVSEGNQVIEELERVTKQLLVSAKDKLRKEEEGEF